MREEPEAGNGMETEMEVDTSMSQNVALRITDLRLAIVNSSADLFADLGRDVDDESLNGSVRGFLDYFKLYFGDSPGVFSRHIDSGKFRDGSEERYSESGLRGFSKWICRVVGALLLCSRLTTVHSELSELVPPLFLDLKHNHTKILVDSIQVLLELVMMVIGKAKQPSGFLKVCFGSEQYRRSVRFRTSVSSVPPEYIQTILKLALPHLDVVEKHNVPFVPLLHVVLFVLKQPTVSIDEKMDLALGICLPLRPTLQHALVLWCNVIILLIEIGIRNEFHQKHLKLLLDRIFAYECPQHDRHAYCFLVAFETRLLNLILDPLFEEAHSEFQSYIIDLYLRVRNAMKCSSIDTTTILRKENSTEFARHIFHSIPVALPILSEVIHKEMFRVLNSSTTPGSIKYSELQKCTPVWKVVRESWITTVLECLQKLTMEDLVARKVVVLNTLQCTTEFIRLIRSVLQHEQSLQALRRVPKGGTVLDFIFREDLGDFFTKLLEVQKQISVLIDGDLNKFLEWMFVLIYELGPQVEDRLNVHKKELLYHITYPSFPLAHVELTTTELQNHHHLYGSESLEKCLDSLGCDFWVGTEEDSKILKVIELAMGSEELECIKALLRLIGGVKCICKSISKDKLLQYIGRLVCSPLWVEDLQVGILLAKAISRIGCLLTMPIAPTKNGPCEVCGAGVYYYEPTNRKMKTVRHWIVNLIERGSSPVHFEILDAMLYLKPHGMMMPDASLIATFSEVTTHSMNFKIVVKFLRNSVQFLTVKYPKHETAKGAAGMFHMIFVHLRNFLTSFVGTEATLEGLVDLLDAMGDVSTVSEDLLAIDLAKTTLLVLTLNWSSWIGGKCRLIFRRLAETRQLKTSEYMGQIRDYLVPDFVKMCFFQIFETGDPNMSQNCRKCEGLLRAVEHAMEFRREDFSRIYFPVLLAHTIPLGLTNGSARQFICSIAQFGLLSVLELLEKYFPYYFPIIGISDGRTTVELNKIIKSLKDSGLSPGILTVVMFQGLMSDLLSYFSVDKEKVKRLLTSIVLWQPGKLLTFPNNITVSSELELRTYITERLMDYFVSLDCKLDSTFENVETKQRAFSSFVEVMEFLGPQINGMKMRIAKLLNSCTKKPYLQALAAAAWKVYTFNLDESLIPTMMNEILASVVYLKSLPGLDVTHTLDEIAYYIISEKNGTTRELRHQVYYLLNHIGHRQTLQLLRNAKLSGQKFFEFLIESLKSGNVHVRFQAILAVDRIVRYEDETVDLKELLEDSQFVHPSICTLILALLECLQLREKELTQGVIRVIGNLGAVDYYRMKVKNSERQSRRDGSSIFPAGQAFALAYIEMLQKQYQGTELSLPSDIDICAYAIQEVLRIYRVGGPNGNPIWAFLSPDTKSLLAPLITSKFILKDLVPQPVYPVPLYGTQLGQNFQAWCTNFVIEMFTFVTSQPAKEIFRVTLPLLARSLPVALYVLPYITLFASLDGTSSQRQVIYDELRKICRLWFIHEAADTDADPPRAAAGRPCTQFDDDSHFEEPPASDARVADRLCVTNAIFTIVDLVSYVSRYGSSNFQILNNIATTGRSGVARSSSPSCSITGTSLTVEKIKMCKFVIPDPLCMARAAFQTQSYQRALLNLEEYLFAFPEKTQRYLSFLQRIFISLNDTDAVAGVSAVRRGKPKIYEETLELLATAKKEDAASKYQLMMQKGFNDFSEESVLMQGYFSIEKPEMALTVMNGLTRERQEISSSPLDDCRIEACWKLQRWGDLRTNLKAVRSDLSSSGTLMHAAILSLFQRKRYGEVLEVIEQAREKCLQSLTSVDINIDAYHSRYAEITRLHMFSEIEQSVEVMKLSERKMNVGQLQAYRSKVSTLLKNWMDRLDLVQKSLSICEPIVNTRKALLHIMKANTKRSSVQKLYSAGLRDCCLAMAKLEIRAKNYGRANACIQEARQFRSPEVLIQDAKFVSHRGDMDRGIRIMNDCMKQYFHTAKISSWESGSASARLEPGQELCAKSLLLLAKFNDEKCNVDMDVNIRNYRQVTEVHKTSEKNYFHLASYVDTIVNAQTVRQRHNEMQEAVVRYYCKSLEYGSKHVYQSLPRLLFVWFNYASSPPSKTEGKSVHEEYVKTLKEMSTCIAKLYNVVPRYIFLTGFSQLISRICHPNPLVWGQLKSMIAGVVEAHPHQALWMMMAVIKSTHRARKSRCAEILREVEEKASLKATISDYNVMADELIELASSEYRSGKVTTIDELAPSLVSLLKKPNFSLILMPFQQFLTVTISRIGNRHLTHKPFLQNLVYIKGIERTVEIMPSLQRPKKITLRGTDGKLYGILCKPDDDMRKDSKVMELNTVVNWYLTKDPEARERNLHVRTYAVVVLNEGIGLLEWVPNLQGLRPLLMKLYRERGLYAATEEVRRLYPTDPGALTQTKLEGFRKLLNRHPPLLREWFLTYFSDPQEWYTARSSFIRTCAVMSMVGYLIGLGDRHGENILLDSVSGDVVHVDFNCLFNKGEDLVVPEMVPFRLTHNMLSAMGPLGSEGPFRRACEITVEILRQNAAVFMSVLRPFVYDPLVEWSKSKNTGGTGNPGPSTSTEVNDNAAKAVKAIQLRLDGVSRNMTKELNVALSTEAQVSYLIKEATSETNLCQMYIGWGPYY